jgi:hypothetical protein
MVTVVNENPATKIEVSMDDTKIDISFGQETEVDVALQAFIKGEPGQPGQSSNRLLYIANIRRGSNFSGTISLIDIIVNTTGKTFVWSSGGGVVAILGCSDINFTENIINASVFMIDNTPNNPLHVTINQESINFGVEPFLSDYRIVLELRQ